LKGLVTKNFKQVFLETTFDFLNGYPLYPLLLEYNDWTIFIAASTGIRGIFFISNFRERESSKKEKSILVLRFQTPRQYIRIFFFLVPAIPTLSLIKNSFVSFLR
jgi:uncharacterized membrane protein